MAQAIITPIHKQVAEIGEALDITRATLNAGETEITFTDARINERTIFSFYTSVWGVNPTAVTVGNGSITLTFDAQEADIEVGVQING